MPDPMTTPPTANGACLCGAIRFAAQLPSKWVAHCHCTYCRRAHGAPFVTWAGFPDDRVTIDDADSALHWYGSSKGAVRGSCSRCGSPMFFKSERWPGELHLARALIDGPLDQEPKAHVYFETHVPWLAFNDDLPKRSSQG